MYTEAKFYVPSLNAVANKKYQTDPILYATPYEYTSQDRRPTDLIIPINDTHSVTIRDIPLFDDFHSKLIQGDVLVILKDVVYKIVRVYQNAPQRNTCLFNIVGEESDMTVERLEN